MLAKSNTKNQFFWKSRKSWRRAKMFFITEEAKETIFDFSQRNMRVL